jgi:predicted DsbA family dithiol-disulfide isomerase
MKNNLTALSWYDFICPFCYIGHQRNSILVSHGVDVVELPFQAHPEIPPAGISVAPRSGQMYAMIEREAREAGLQLKWPRHLPHTGRALAAAEWVRRYQPQLFPKFQKDVFDAHFAVGEDLGNPAVIDRHATQLGVDLIALHAALVDGSAAEAVSESEILGRKHGAHGTPAWLLGDHLISGLRSAAELERLAQNARQQMIH